MSEAFWNAHPHDVILKPVTSEKSARMEDEGKYTFLVDPRANKTQIKQAVEAVFGVKVESVNTQNRLGKTRRTRNGLGKSKDTTRAIVTLREGTIDIYGDNDSQRGDTRRLEDLNSWEFVSTSRRPRVVAVRA